MLQRSCTHGCWQGGGWSVCGGLAAQMNPYVSHLSLYDVVGTPGVAADISHINSKAQVKVRRPPWSRASSRPLR